VTGAVQVLSGRGSAELLPGLLAGRRVLAVASPATIERTGLARWLPDDAELFSAFHPNPTVDEATAAAARRVSYDAEVVVGIGGGSAMDVAKAARALPPGPDALVRLAEHATTACTDAELVLVPTTSGTGSEVTRFAALYRQGRKLSIDGDGVMADIAVIDPALCESCPPDLTWNGALDTMAHAVESLWSTQVTGLSQHYARAALDHVLPVLHNAAAVPNADERDALSMAGTLAGHAIDVTRTTAGHAFAYPLTAHLGVPHGLACALNLTWLAPLVEHAQPDAPAIEQLRDAFGLTTTSSLGAEIRELLDRRDKPTRLAVTDPALVDRVIAEGLASTRVIGTPIAIDRSVVEQPVTDLLGLRPTHPDEAAGA
jgi:alcohol dehydrogenase class IV